MRLHIATTFKIVSEKQEGIAYSLWVEFISGVTQGEAISQIILMKPLLK